MLLKDLIQKAVTKVNAESRRKPCKYQCSIFTKTIEKEISSVPEKINSCLNTVKEKIISTTSEKVWNANKTITKANMTAETRFKEYSARIDKRIKSLEDYWKEFRNIVCIKILNLVILVYKRIHFFNFTVLSKLSL